MEHVNNATLKNGKASVAPPLSEPDAAGWIAHLPETNRTDCPVEEGNTRLETIIERATVSGMLVCAGADQLLASAAAAVSNIGAADRTEVDGQEDKSPPVSKNDLLAIATLDDARILTSEMTDRLASFADSITIVGKTLKNLERTLGDYPS
jgi:hypothetical protein